MNIELKIESCTEAHMARLEACGVITRLQPGRHVLAVGRNESRHETLYASDPEFGPHKLICVTINREDYDRFLYHNDNEEFMLIDRPDAAPLVMLFSLCHQEVLNQKIQSNQLTPEDFMVLTMPKNDPNLSFFTMNKGFPHVEMCYKTSDCPPSFYVTEGRDIDEQFIDFRNYRLEIER